MRLGDLTSEHYGMHVLGISELGSWSEYVVLTSVKHTDAGTAMHFYWSDDPNPANTHPGKFAIGYEDQPSDLECSVKWPAYLDMDPH